MEFYMINVLDFINHYIGGDEDLQPEMFEVIKDFSLLWSLFEGQIFETNFNVRLLENKIIRWSQENLINSEYFSKVLEYFKHRYFENGEESEHFRRLNFRSSHHESLVRSVLLGQKTDLISLIQAVVIIIYRFRNNFFHGNKWEYRFSGQLQNFTISNEVLVSLLEIERNHRSIHQQ